VSRGGPGDRQQGWSTAVAGWAEYRRQADERRLSLARTAAEPMIADLAAIAMSLSDAELEDELCSRIGTSLAPLKGVDIPVDDYVSPNTFIQAVVEAAVNAVAAALAAETNDWTQAWRLLTAAASIVNYPYDGEALSSIDELRTRPGGQLLPKTPTGPAVTGPVLWTRDAYGSRFGIVAPLRTADGAQRWYLWDVDACGHHAFTVHSRYHATPEAALADWQAGVGTPAAAGTVLMPVDDTGLLEDLLPGELGVMRPGGENVEQLAEYHRSKRLAEAVLETIEQDRPHQTPVPARLDQTTAPTHFAVWLREHRPDRSRQADIDELVNQLADSWYIDGPAALFHTCSPHRVALVAEHMRSFYEEDFAADLITLLPDWAAWLADLNTTPAHLADRCHPYARGEIHAAVHTDDRGPIYVARIPE
jgi:hypothetical protein